MVSFKVVIQKQRRDGFWPVYIRITHNRGIKYINTGKIVDSKGVAKKNKEVKDPFVLQACSLKIAKFAEMLNKVEIRKWTVHDVTSYLEKGTEDICFSDYARKYRDKLYNEGHARNARNYELAYQHLERYNMDAMLFTMTGVAIIAVGIALWINTKSGKKWLKEL